MIRVHFVKPVWLFISGDQAILPERVARHITGIGFAYTLPERAAAPPVVLPESPAPETVADNDYRAAEAQITSTLPAASGKGVFGKKVRK